MGVDRTRFQSSPSTKSQKLGIVELDPAVCDARPAELGFLQPPGAKANAGAIPPYDLHTVCSFRPEGIKSSVEGLGGAPPNRSYASGEILWRIRSCAGRGLSNLEFSVT